MLQMANVSLISTPGKTIHKINKYIKTKEHIHAAQHCILIAKAPHCLRDKRLRLCSRTNKAPCKQRKKVFSY